MAAFPVLAIVAVLLPWLRVTLGSSSDSQNSTVSNGIPATESLPDYSHYQEFKPHQPPPEYERPPERPDPMRSMSAEKALLNKLLANYDRIGRPGRPVLNVATTTEVVFTLGLIQMDLDEHHKILTMSMWTRYQWRDEYMSWNASEYDGVQAIRVEPQMIWIPDITLYNTADADAPARHALAVVSYDGVVTWYPHTIFKSSCSIDVTNFPFDKQQCHMWFGSWTHTSREISLRTDNNPGIDLSTFKSDYKESSAWDIIGVTATRNVMPSENDYPNYIVLMFDLSMKRKLVFSSYILTLPVIFLAFLTLVVFWLPPERPDRTGLAMSTFSSFMLLLLILVEAAPPTASSIPVIGIYYCFNMVIIMMSIILSSLVVNISRGSNRHVPGWLRVMVIDGIGRLIYFGRRPAFTNKIRTKRTDGPTDTNDDTDAEALTMLTTTTSSDVTPVPHMRLCDHAYAQNNWNENHVLENLPEEAKCTLRGLDQQVGEIKRVLQKMESRMADKSNADAGRHEIKEEWRRVAVVLDRFFFVLYIILIIVSLSVLFPKPS